ncbi:MAG: HAMP domain-containing sensor histidine kinase [Clostridia bacterium]
MKDRFFSMMNSKLFIKLYIRISLVIFAAFAVMSVTLFAFVYNYSITSMQKQLSDSANRIASFSYILSENAPPQILRTMQNSIDFYAESVKADANIFDNDGNLLFTTSERIITNHKISPEIVGEITSGGSYAKRGTLGGFLTEDFANVGVPFNNSNMQIEGVVILSSSIRPFAGLFADIMGMFFISLVVSLLMAYILLYFITKRFISPLNNINKTVKEFSQGNFTSRLSFTGDDEVSELSNSINQLAYSLENLEKLRYDFISDVSHELKTPLTSIIGFVDAILDGVIEKKDYDHYLNIISSEMKRLSRLVASLLDITKYTNNIKDIEFTDFNIYNMSCNVLNNLTFKASEKNIEFNLECGENLIALGNEDSIYRVVYNLVENAIKFSFDNTQISINIAQKDNKTYVGIKNSGVGIDQNDIPFIFNRFYKSDKSRGQSKGYGLGLYLCKEIVVSHGGDIWVKSVPNDTTEFVFYINNKKEKEQNRLFKK